MTLAQDIVNKINVHVFRKNNVVYVATPKCGSTYYVTMLQVNGWGRIYFSEIDWDNNIVLGFVRDVRERYLKGIVEDVLETRDPASLQNVIELAKKYDKDFLVVSYHTMPITQLFNGYYNKIRWIPITKGFDHNKEFERICGEQGIRLLFKQHPNIDEHHSDIDHKNLYQQLIDSKAFAQETHLYRIQFSGDQDLYNSAKANYNLS